MNDAAVLMAISGLLGSAGGSLNRFGAHFTCQMPFYTPNQVLGH